MPADPVASSRVEQLALAHPREHLLRALVTSLRPDEHRPLAYLLHALRPEDAPPPAEEIAPVLVARLDCDGRSSTARALAAVLAAAGIACTPRFRFPDDEAELAGRRRAEEVLRGRGEGNRIHLLETSGLFRMRQALVHRLAADGHRPLADALVDVWTRFDGGPSAEIGPPPPAQIEANLQADEAPRAPHSSEELGRRYPPEVLVRALIERLRGEGREEEAGSIMTMWVDGTVGPIVDPSVLAPVLIARLRAEARGEIADALESLLGGAAIGREVMDLEDAWRSEVAGPTLHAEALGAALAARLRSDGRDEIARLAAATLR